MVSCVELSDIKAAQTRFADHLTPTPCKYSRALSDLTGAKLYLKFENLQFTASFKERGALNRMLQLSAAERRQGVCAASDGNHGLAVAYQAQRLGIPATIVMAQHTPFVKVEHTQFHGAEVILAGETLQEAHDEALRLSRARALTFIHPYEDVDVIAGQGTAALELLSAEPGLDAIVVQIGGGGLMAGIAVAIKSLAPHISMIGVQSVLHPTMPAALRGEFPTFRGTTVAEGIAAKRPGRLACELIRKCVDDIVLVDDARLEHGVGLLLSHEKTVTEGAGAAGLAAVLAQPERYRGRKIGLILSGGNIDPRLLASMIMRELVRDKCILTLRLPVADRPGALSRITHVIGQHGGNVLEVFHRRLSLDAPARFATLEITYEAPDRQIARCIADELEGAGIEFVVVPC